MTQFWLTKPKNDKNRELSKGAMVVPLLMLFMAVIVSLSSDFNVYKTVTQATCEAARELGLDYCASGFTIQAPSFGPLATLKSTSTLAHDSIPNTSPGLAKKRPQHRKMGNPPVSLNSPTTVLLSNPKLASRLQKRLGLLLPDGMGIADAAQGFRNLGDFIAAVHVAHNLGLPFAHLKAKMLSGASLSNAISELKAGVIAADEAQQAGKQASDDLQVAKNESQPGGKG